MSDRTLASRIAAVLAAGGVVACSAEAPVEPGGAGRVTPAVATVDLETFTHRAPLEPYRIHQLPDFMIHSKARSDLIIQQSRFTGTGGWHTHPGLSYAFVLQGQVKLQKFTEKDGCFETPVYGPGDVYIKPPDELHRAIVVSEEPEWELIVRLFPEGAPIAVTAAQDPAC